MKKLTAQEIRIVSARAGVDTRTVARVFADGPTRTKTRMLVLAAADAEGIRPASEARPPTERELEAILSALQFRRAKADSGSAKWTEQMANWANESAITWATEALERRKSVA